ncbi:MAG: phage tail protein, partial [Alcaligenes aquatilis]
MSRIEEGRLVVTPHPLTLEGQTNTPADLRAGESLLSFLERHVPNLHVCKYAVSINGCPISPDHWSRVKPKHGTVIAVRSVVEKEALQLVALAALTYFTFGIGSAGGFVATSFGKLAATAVFMAGSMLINKVLAPPMPEIGSTDLGREPTYSIAPGSNRARQHEALPLLLGSIQYAPDYASLPYTWYEGNEQVLGAVFNAGLNVDCFEGVLLNGDTDLSAYQDVSVWTRGFPGMPEQDIPLFTNPDVSDGGELEGTGEWVTRTTSLDTTLIQCDFEIQLFGQGKKGVEGRNLVLEGRYRPLGTAQWRPIQSIYLSNRAMKPLRRTETIPVESGQYEVAWRNATGGSSDDGKTTRNAVWTQMKSIQPDDGDYLGQSRIGIKVKATGQLNGSLKEIKGQFVARAMPIWNGSSWGVATTPDNGLSNPGAQILLLARGIYVEDPFYGRKLIAGMGLPDDQIDIEGLKAFMLHCTANDLRHDALISDDRSNV